MPLDAVSLLDAAVIVLSAAVFAAAAFRAVQLRRAFVNRVYRSLATSLALVAIATMAATAIVYPYIFSNPSNTSVTVTLTRFVYAVALVRFIDRTSLVAMETDFFHRDWLHWRRVRKLAYVALFVFLLVYATITYFVPPDTPVLPLLSAEFAYALFGFVFLGYLVALLVVSARRTPDVILKGSVRLLGLFALFFFVSTTFNSILQVLILHDVLVLLASYFFYRAVMSLSPVGRVRALEVSSGVGGRLGSSSTGLGVAAHAT